MPIADALQEVIDLQSSYSAGKSEAMLRRAQLVKTSLPAALNGFLNKSSDMEGFLAEGSGGIGVNAVVPWTRVYNPEHSPSPQSGWYLVYLFAADGASVSLSLNLGVTKLTRKEIEAKVSWAREILGASLEKEGSAATVNSTIDLKAGSNQLARLYERGNVTAYVYESGQIPADSVLEADLRRLGGALRKLMSAEEPNNNFGIGPEEIDELDELVTRTHWSREQVANVLESLFDSSPQIVLYGPPGTGKTFVAQQFARYIVAEGNSVTSDRVKIVQFHPSYGYEDFVEGLRPISNDEGNIVFQTVPGALLEFVDLIETDGLPRVLIIDEMNRANLPRVFGELLFLLEYRSQPVSLMLRKDFRLPQNLFIIGTMNTADRNIKNLDIALRRRFDFFALLPDVNVLRAHYSRGNSNELGELLYSGFEALNDSIVRDMGERGYAVGHSYFMHGRIDASLLHSVWDRQILPLLEDYFSDRIELLEEYSLEKFWGLG